MVLFSVTQAIVQRVTGRLVSLRLRLRKLVRADLQRHKDFCIFLIVKRPHGSQFS